MKKLLLVAFALLLLLLAPAHQNAARADPGDISIGWLCTSGKKTMELGESIPYYYFEWSNQTDSDVTLTVSVNSNKFFGPEHDLYTETLYAHIGKKCFDCGVAALDIPYSTPIGTDNVVIKATVDGSVLEQCSLDLTLVLPSKLKELIQVPVRWCALEGSPAAEGKKPGELAPGAGFLSWLRSASDEMWIPGANIAFVSAPGSGIPVVKDPWPPDVVGYGKLGDIKVSGFGSNVGPAAIECAKRWGNAKGVIAISGGVIWAAGDMLGFAPEPSNVLVNSSRPNDLCGDPRKLAVSDVTSQFVGMQARSRFTTGLGATVTLAHELGHTLLLGHGDGLDNNHDGLEPPTDGIRRYDSYCDPQGEDPDRDGFPKEDIGTTAFSLMDYSNDTHLTPLQVEQARAVAKLVPGAAFDAAADPAGALVDSECDEPPCGLPPDVFIGKAEMSETPSSQTTEFSHTVWGPIPPDADNEYMVFADLDNNAATGCAPSALGVPTAFQGAELVTRVSLGLVGGTQQATPTVWRCQGGALVEAADPGIGASAFTQAEAHTGVPLFGIVSIQMPDAVRGPAGTEVRIQALARQMGPGGQLDRLPNALDGGGVISLVTPTLPQATVAPPGVNPGGTITIKASGLLPDQTAEAYVGDQLLGTGPIDGAGNAQIDVVVPASSRQGVRLVTVLVQGTVVSATGALLVDGPPLTPATTATLSPLPNGAGWNKSDVTVTLTTTGDVITYSASGAQTIAPTVVVGTSATITITAEGETTITYFGADSAGNSEAPQSVAVRLDKTAPSITGSRTPPPGASGWNKEDVTVTFVCADATSGVADCPEPTILTAEGANQSVTGIAADFAGNTASAIVSGINIDKTPPTTAYLLDPPQSGGKHGWYISDVTVCLSASDPLLDDGSPGSGVRETLYQVNGGGWQSYGGCFAVGTESWDNVVEFYSTDYADNVEATKEVHFKIDKTPPEIHISEGILDGLHWDQVHLERGVLTNTDTLALSGGAADNLCLWEVRAVNDAMPPIVEPWNQELPLPWSLGVPLHTGTNTIDVIAEDCAGWEKAIFIQVVYVIPGPYDPRTKGFWYNAVNTGKYSEADFQTLLDYINVVSDTFGPATRNIYGPATLANYHSILSPVTTDMETLQKAQLLDTWLNLVSGRVAVLTAADLNKVKGWAQVVDNTGGSPLTFALNVPMEVEEVDQTRMATRPVYEIAKNLLDAFNSRKIIP